MREIIIPKGYIMLELRDVRNGRTTREFYKNLITTVGKESLASGIRGDTTNNRGIITYCALGTDDTAPALGNTQLGTELTRKLVSVRTSSNNIATFQTFFTTSEGNGTLKEAGLFGDDAIAAPNSGTLFAHAAIDRTKTSNDTLTLQWDVVIG